jgi:glycosyltransferase involved in cell wall biosynthesis
LKIVQIVPSLEARHGGPTRSVFALSAALVDVGHSVDLFTTDPGPETTRLEGSLRITHHHRDWPERVCRSASLRDAIAHSGAGVFHHHALWLRTLHYTHRRAAGRDVFVISPRGAMGPWAWNHHRHRKRLANALLHPGALAAVDGWHATSVEEEAEIRARGFTQPVCVAPNGIEPPAAATVAHARDYWNERCPATRSRPVALFYSRFHSKKRVLELIDLWLEAGPRDWLLLLVGIPQDYTPELLERHVHQRSGAGRVAVFSGADRPAPYPVASLFLLPSHNENFGLVIAEALAHAVPALVTDTTPWRGLNTDNRGWCVPWAEYATALRSATSEPVERLAERGARARTWALGEFSWVRSATRLAEFYGELRDRRKTIT